MNTYVLGSLVTASVVLPMVLAWAIAHTYRTTKIILRISWVLVVCAAGGLLSYAGDKTTLLDHLSGWVAWPIIIWNVIMFFDAIDSPFEPKQSRKSKLGSPKKDPTITAGITSLSKEQLDNN